MWVYVCFCCSVCLLLRNEPWWTGIRYFWHTKVWLHVSPSILGSYLRDITTSSTTLSFEVCKSLKEIYITFQLSRGCALGRNWLRPQRWTAAAFPEGKGNGYYGGTVQGQSRSPLSVAIESLYATSYMWIILTYILSRTVSKISHAHYYWSNFRCQQEGALTHLFEVKT